MGSDKRVEAQAAAKAAGPGGEREQVHAPADAQGAVQDSEDDEEDSHAKLQAGAVGAAPSGAEAVEASAWWKFSLAPGAVRPNGGPGVAADAEQRVASAAEKGAVQGSAEGDGPGAIPSGRDSAGAARGGAAATTDGGERGKARDKATVRSQPKGKSTRSARPRRRASKRVLDGSAFKDVNDDLEEDEW